MLLPVDKGPASICLYLDGKHEGNENCDKCSGSSLKLWNSSHLMGWYAFISRYLSPRGRFFVGVLSLSIVRGL
jgi:hypothetical protein